MEAASARYAGGYASRDRFGAFGEPANSTLQRYICSFVTGSWVVRTAERENRQRVRSTKYGAKPGFEFRGLGSYKLQERQCVRFAILS
jgi:hypothetical protein